jgi:hypothetical protein
VKFEPGLGEIIKYKDRSESRDGKAIPEQSCPGPESFRNLRLSDFTKIGTCN